MVISSAFMYALHAAIVKRDGGGLEFLPFFLFRLASTTGFLLLFVAGSGQWVWPTGDTWLILLAAGTVDVVVSRLLYYAALRRMRLGLHAVVLTLSPVVTIFWSLLLFQEGPTMQALAGGLIVLTGIVIITFGRRQ
jgi:drug/metabolite transporter (DMT)-like permease